MQLPPLLRTTLESFVGSLPNSEVQKTSAILSSRYRHLPGPELNATTSFQIRSTLEAKSYLASRFPATYCAGRQVLSHIEEILPGLNPSSLLDIGAGPSTATLASLAHWPSLQRGILLEPNQYFTEVGRQLLKCLNYNYEPQWLSQNVSASLDADLLAHDVVFMSYALNEIIEEQGASMVATILQKIWSLTGKILIILEPGTPTGQSNILFARDHLIRNGAHSVAPCPHDRACPLSNEYEIDKRWCHFSVRVERSRLHKNSKISAQLPYEDEKFSYIVFSRQPVAHAHDRLISLPRGSNVIHAEVCRREGKSEKISVTKSSALYKDVKNSRWGDLFPERHL